MTTDPAPEPRSGVFSSPVSLFVLSTAMASTAATAVAFMLFGSAASTEPAPCTCVCEGSESAPSGPASIPAQPTAAPAVASPSSAPPKLPRVRQAKATVEGSLDKNIIRRIVRAHINEVRYCYDQGLAADPQLEGRVVVQFTIAGSGTVSEAEVASSSLGDEETAACIAKAVKRWAFPKPQGGGDVVITYPFVLSPG